MNRALTALIVAATVLLASAPGPFTPSERRLYLREFDSQTRKLVVHNEFSTGLILRGTLLTPEFRAILSRERERLLDPLPEGQASFEARMREDAAAYHEVVFSADGDFQRKMRFGPGDDRWNIRLIADGTVEELVTVYHVREPTPLHLGLYPHINQWSELYIARFRRTVATPNEVIFHVGSGFGNDELIWTDLRR